MPDYMISCEFSRQDPLSGEDREEIEQMLRVLVGYLDIQQVLIKDITRCEAYIWHGPGHQSRTTCRILGPHKQHSTLIVREGNWEDVFWSTPFASTGFMNESPEEEAE